MYLILTVTLKHPLIEEIKSHHLAMKIKKNINDQNFYDLKSRHAAYKTLRASLKFIVVSGHV